MNIEMLLVHRRLSLKKSFSRARTRRRVKERREGKRHRLEQSSPYKTLPTPRLCRVAANICGATERKAPTPYKIE